MVFSINALGRTPARLHPLPKRSYGLGQRHAFASQDATDNFSGQLAGNGCPFHFGDTGLLHDGDGLFPVGLFGGDRPALAVGGFEADVIDAIFFREFHLAAYGW